MTRLIHRHSRIVPSSCNTHSPTHIRELWRPLHCVRDRKGAWRESKRMTPSRIARRYEGDEEERNCDKGRWQTVTGTTLSATRFCAYHSPPVYHHRRQCRRRAIWSDLILVALIRHPLSTLDLPSRLPSYLISLSASFTRGLPHPCLSLALVFFPKPTARSQVFPPSVA